MDKNRKKSTLKEKILTFIMMLLGNHLNYYSSYLGEPKNSLITLIFNYFVPRVSIPKEDKKTIRELGKKGTIVYAQKNRSSLDFLFFQHRYYIEGLPYPIFGNFINMIWWQPLTSVLRIILSKLYCLIDGIESPNPYRTDYVRRMSQDGHSLDPLSEKPHRPLETVCHQRDGRPGGLPAARPEGNEAHDIHHSAQYYLS